METGLQFRDEKSKGDEAAAQEVAARSLLAQGRIEETQTAIKQANSLSHGESNLPLAFDIADTSARINIARKPPPSRFTANTRKNLESSLLVARRYGYLEYQYKLNLTLGEAELKSGDAAKGRARLGALVKDAAGNGFVLIAQHAAAILRTSEYQ